jgi:sulfonate transport system substrate-binding protein
MATTVKIGGVPEHFNYSWHKAMEEGLFSSNNIDVQWTDFPGGTGAMAESLSMGILDVAIMLTEGAVAAIAKGCPARILHFAVDSPLVWGIHTGAGSTLQIEEDIKGKTIAISRYGSGSHLMSIVQAYQKKWALDHMQWLEVKNIDGARQALLAGKADVFLWERYTTKPLVDEGSFRLLGLLPTPWPAFVLVVSNAFLEKHKPEVEQISKVILEVQKTLKQEPFLAQTLSMRYQLKEVDVLEWLKQTEWSGSTAILEQQIGEVIESLLKAEVLECQIEPQRILAR